MSEDNDDTPRIMVIKFGDEDHEPTQKRLEQTIEQIREGLSEENTKEYDILVMPYYVDIFTTGEDDLRDLNIDKEKLAKLEEVKSDILDGEHEDGDDQ